MFDSVEARVNASVFKALANATASWSGVDAINVVFDPSGAFVDDVGVLTYQPMFEAPSTSLGALSEGVDIVVRGENYRVRQVQPLDEGLRTRVVLART